MKASTIKNSKDILYKLLILIFWIGVWQLIHMRIGRDIYVPSPLRVILRLRELLLISSFWTSVFYSIFRVAAGLLLAVLVGVTLGIICGFSKLMHDIFKPMVIVVQSTPVVSFILIAIIWFASSRIPIFMCFLMCFPVVWTNVVAGFNSVDKKLLEMARVYQVKDLMILKNVYLPTIRPYFYAACITSLGLGWKVSVAAEVLSHPRHAIGSQIYSAKVYLDSTDLFAWTLVIILLSVLFEILFVHLIKRATTRKRPLVTEYEKEGEPHGYKNQGAI